MSYHPVDVNQTVTQYGTKILPEPMKNANDQLNNKSKILVLSAPLDHLLLHSLFFNMDQQVFVHKTNDEFIDGCLSILDRSAFSKKWFSYRVCLWKCLKSKYASRKSKFINPLFFQLTKQVFVKCLFLFYFF